MSLYAVILAERSTGKVEAVLARGMQYHHADTFAAEMMPRAREGFYFKAVNENELPA